MDTMTILSNLTPADLDAGTVFSGQPTGTVVTGYAGASIFTPKIDPNYIFHEQSRDIVVWFIAQKIDPLYVYGSSGCGKSSAIKQLAARLNYTKNNGIYHHAAVYQCPGCTLCRNRSKHGHRRAGMAA